MSENEGPNKELPWVKSPSGVFEVYANMAHITWTLDDIRIRLGQVVGSAATPNPGPEYKGVSEERAAVTLSWRSAKIIRDQLTGIINSYENANGVIKTDPTLPLPPK